MVQSVTLGAVMSLKGVTAAWRDPADLERERGNEAKPSTCAVHERKAVVRFSLLSHTTPTKILLSCPNPMTDKNKCPIPIPVK